MKIKKTIAEKLRELPDTLQGPPHKTHQANIRLSNLQRAEIDLIAEMTGKTRTDLLREAWGVVKEFYALDGPDGKIVIVDADGNQREVLVSK